MSLSTDFIEKFTPTNDLHGVTPVLLVEAKGPTTGWTLGDGKKSKEFFFKTGSGPIETLAVGVRIILLEYYLTKNVGKFKKALVSRLIICSGFC
jgi:hypothetical protein